MWREKWRGALATLIERQSAKACAGAGIAAEDMGDTLGEDAASNLFGAAFEDLLATDLTDGRNIADDYLRRRGWKESVSTREYIAGLRRSVISLYEVSGLVPGESMLLRYLIRDAEPVRVWEKSGSQGLRPWDRIATRLIPLRDHTVISGILLALDSDTSERCWPRLDVPATRRPETWPWSRASSASMRMRSGWPACSRPTCRLGRAPFSSPTSGWTPR